MMSNPDPRASPLLWVICNCKGCCHVKKGLCYVLAEFDYENPKHTTTIAKRYLKHQNPTCGFRNKRVELQ